MCGIAGYVTRSGPERDRLLSPMLERIKHRGPDGEGRWVAQAGDWMACLGHRRLSIIDIEGGRQPLGNEDGSVQITFNGEIYNFQALREQLLMQGHRFTTRSDTEVIVHHYEEQGMKGVAELNGMFAFAIWDQRTRALHMARDRAGIKPLFYAPLDGGGVAFASELTALLAHPGVRRKLSRDAIPSYFFSDYVLHPGSLIEGVYKLEPGHSVTWRDGVLSQPMPFWQLNDRPESPLSETELVTILRERLHASVERQMVSDVPLGVFLSGGIDSSTVAAIAQTKIQQPLRTFSIAFEDASFDEGAYARQVAKFIGSYHIEETLSVGALIEATRASLDCLDEPVADPSIVPTYLLSRLASRHVKVALGGDGGDELWAGYPTYRAHRYSSAYGALPSFVRDQVIARVVSRLPVSDRYQSLEWKAKRFTGRWDQDARTRHLRWMSNTDLPELGSLGLSGQMPATLSKPGVGRFVDPINDALALDFGTYMTGSVLAKVDRAAMAHGLEVRPPLLDNELIEFAFSVPSRFKLRGSTGKYLLKKAVQGMIPDEIIHRPKKGFAIPLSQWMRGPLRPMIEATLKESPLWDGVLSHATFKSWLSEHAERRRDRSRPLWALLVLDHWMKREAIAVSEVTRVAA